MDLWEVEAVIILFLVCFVPGVCLFRKDVEKGLEEAKGSRKLGESAEAS